MTSGRFEPAIPVIELLQIYVVDGTATGIDNVTYRGGTVSPLTSTILLNRIIKSEITDV
jgi:hypothetical protein